MVRSDYSKQIPYVMDTEDDLENLPGLEDGLGVGSKAFCISSSKEYILNSVGEWVEIVKSGGSSVDVEEITITENGTYTAEDGQAYNPVNVEVPTTDVYFDGAKSTASRVDIDHPLRWKNASMYQYGNSTAFINNAAAPFRGVPLVVYDDEIYAVDTRYLYKWANNRWTQVKSWGITLKEPRATEFDEDLHIVAYKSIDGVDYWQHGIFDFAGNNQSAFATIDSSLTFNDYRAAHIVNYNDNDLYCIFLKSPSNTSVNNKIYKYKSSTWEDCTSSVIRTQLDDFNKCDYESSVIYCQNEDGRYIHLMGGKSNPTHHFAIDVRNRTCVSETMPYEIDHAIPAVLDDKIYLFGGGDVSLYPNGTNEVIVFYGFESYEKLSADYNSPSTIPCGGAATLDDTIYVYGFYNQYVSGSAKYCEFYKLEPTEVASEYN